MGSDTGDDAYSDIHLRALNCEVNPLTRSDGSAMLTQGETAVIASVYGPVEVKTQNLQIENATLDVCYRPKTGLPTITDRSRENVIKRICETAILTALHPRTSIVVVIQELENRSGLEACAVNAVCLALLNGGIAMKFTVAGVHSILKENDEIVLDPDSKESINALAHFTFVFDSLQRNVVAVNTQGKFNMAQYNDALTICRAASGKIFEFYREIISKRPV
ncbi:unnamed protein product [Hermetia illucens]|uniref:Exoribonuclease phosphorolytic domain-containing protein n=1 Tax=Hermetia illucens TaxID=343691 RepID=A0A7R8Z1M9_HERIL|nr:exosome complex component RRP46 [Hermetia illucens]XP_037924233.1 exosome complex component RRP46 [Hermetia illucens]CAD7092736.1 unnamed protein product [Hermetia illucens]